jgi:hypothetical protein
LDTPEEFVEVDVKVGQQDGQGRQRGHGPTVLDGAHQRSRVRPRDGSLTETCCHSSPTELAADHPGQLAGTK